MLGDIQMIVNCLEPWNKYLKIILKWSQYNILCLFQQQFQKYSMKET